MLSRLVTTFLPRSATHTLVRSLVPLSGRSLVPLTCLCLLACVCPHWPRASGGSRGLCLGSSPLPRQEPGPAHLSLSAGLCVRIDHEPQVGHVGSAWGAHPCPGPVPSLPSLASPPPILPPSWRGSLVPTPQICPLPRSSAPSPACLAGVLPPGVISPLYAGVLCFFPPWAESRHPQPMCLLALTARLLWRIGRIQHLCFLCRVSFSYWDVLHKS